MNQKATSGYALGEPNTPESNSYNADHEHMLRSLQDSVTSTLNLSGVRLFKTDHADNLFDVYLDALPAQELRQHHNCSACRHFVNHFGGLVAIGEDGNLHSPMWDLPGMENNFYGPAVRAVAKAARISKVTGIFLTSDTTLGQPHTGMWTHLAVQLPRISLVRKFKATQTANQAAAEKKEDFKNLMVALNEFERPSLEAVVQLFKSDVLYRSEKFLAPAEFLLNLLNIREQTKQPTLRHNLMWLAIAAAPAGFCHPKSGVLGTLLFDLQNGLPFETAKARFKALNDPAVYQRPTEAPKAGNAARAEKIIADLGVASALERRFARFDEVQFVWTPPVAETKASGGVFGHLETRGGGVKKGELLTIAAGGRTPITWERFEREVMPNAETIRYLVTAGRSTYHALLTSVNSDAKPILQWDSADERNPVSWYTYCNGSSPAQWNLKAGQWSKVMGVTRKPNQWNGRNKAPNQGEGVVLILENCRDTGYQDVGNGLFPEILKSEFHEIRSTIEAYSNKAEIQGYADATANGVSINKGTEAVTYDLEVVTKGLTIVYKIDRWN